MSKPIDIDLLEPSGDPGGESLYVSERKVYPRDVSGRFDRLRKLAVFWLLGMYYVFPWLQWDGRHGSMPAHGELLGPTRSRLVAAWVWSLSNPPAQPVQ